MFFIFQKWTKKMSKNEIPKKLSPKKIKNFTTRVGNFFDDFKEKLEFLLHNVVYSTYLSHKNIC